MNFNVYIEDDLARKLEIIANFLGKKKNYIIREALSQWVETHSEVRWPDSIKTFEGIKDFPAFESHRNELLAPKEDIF